MIHKFWETCSKIHKFLETCSYVILNPNVKFRAITQLQALQNSIGVSENSEEISSTPKRTSRLLFASPAVPCAA